MAALQVPKTLYSKLLASCGIAALLISAVAVASFYGYRHNRLGNSLSVDISNTAQRISPLVNRSLHSGRPREARRLLGIFAGLPYVRCVDLNGPTGRIISWPAPGCISTGNQQVLAFGNGPEDRQLVVHINDHILRRDLFFETSLFGGVLGIVMILMFVSLTASFRHIVLVPLDALKSAMHASRPERPVWAKFIRHDEIGDLVTVYNKLAATSRYYMRQLDQSRRSLQEREALLQDSNRYLNESVQYASTIQRALLSDRKTIAEKLGKTAVIWQPKDFVGGDFYWFGQIAKQDFLIFFDCTGHGVPGALMTLIVVSEIEKISIAANAPVSTADLLQMIHIGVCRSLGLTDLSAPGGDGLDCAAIRFSVDRSNVQFSGASMDLHIVPEAGNSWRLRGQRVSLGYQLGSDLPLFETHHAPIEKNSFVIASDGLVTQVGDTSRRAFGSRRFVATLDDVTGNDPAHLVRGLARALNNWQGSQDRRDDVTVLAFNPTMR